MYKTMRVMRIYSSIEVVYIWTIAGSLSVEPFRWFPLVILGYCWLSLVIAGYRWLSLVIAGYRWLSLVIAGYRWLSLVNSWSFYLSATADDFCK